VTRWNRLRSEATPDVCYAQFHPPTVSSKLHVDVPSVGVLDNVVKRLLGNTVERDLHIGG
jgi:hypothetical protein